MIDKVLVDAGPLAALVNRRDQWHDWARAQLGEILTLDRDFRVYRRHRRQKIPLLIPPEL